VIGGLCSACGEDRRRGRAGRLRAAAASLATFAVVACATSPTGRSQLLIVPESMAIAASRQAYTEQLAPLARAGKLDTDGRLVAQVERITSRLVAQAVEMRPETRSWDWTIRVIDEPQVNAWAMPGGRMALYTGLVETIQPSDDELAQVLGHEIAHALAKHGAEKMSIALVNQLGVGAVGAASNSPEVARAAALAAQLAIGLPNSRSAESEADRIGIELAARAGYDPRAASTLWQKMAEVSGGQGPPQILSTHPDPGRRAEVLSALAPEMLPLYRAAGANPPSWPVNRGGRD